MRTATPAFICFPFSWNIFFHPLNLYVSLGLKWVSCRQHTYGSCFCIHSASLCLLVGTFNPFIFKVIVYIYVPIAIILILGGWFCKSFFFFCISWLYNPFSICCKADLVVLISLNLSLSEKLWFLHQFWMRSLLVTVILVVDFSLSVLPFPSGLQSFCWKISC